MKPPGWNAIRGVFLATILFAPSWGATPALPGTMNDIGGKALIGLHTLNSQSIESTELQTGQTLKTQNGKAEFLLTPGVFVRVGDNSSVTMLSPTLAKTAIKLNQGRTMIEVDQIRRSNDLSVMEGDATTHLLKTGLYDFDLRDNQLRVFEGEARVQKGEQQTIVKAGHEVDLVASNGKLTPTKFDETKYVGDLSQLPKPNENLIRQDPAFRAGYDDGYRRGANDSMANSNTYNDENSSLYELATNGYSASYGDLKKYRKLFRLGYIDGYKAGWDFNSGQYCGSCGPGGP